MRTVFFGASALGYAACERLIESGNDVAGIVTLDQEMVFPVRGTSLRNVLHRDFHTLGDAHGVPTVTARPPMSSLAEQVREWAPDLCLVVGWYYLLPASLRAIPPLGFAGVHASLLPKYRGGSPLVWAMINGERETGVTLFYFSDEIDAGDVIGQRRFRISDSDTIRQVLRKATVATAELLDEMVPQIASGAAPRVPQRAADATYFPQRHPEDGRIDWSWEPRRIRDFIRAQTRPYPGAFTELDGVRVTIWDATIEPAGRGPVEDSSAPPGLPGSSGRGS